MHEIGVLDNALKSIEEIAREENIGHVTKIVLEVGELTGILPTVFESMFPLLIEDRPLFRDAELDLRIRPGRGLCNACENMYNVFKHEGACPACGSREKTVISGTELIIREIMAETGEFNGSQDHRAQEERF